MKHKSIYSLSIVLAAIMLTTGCNSNNNSTKSHSSRESTSSDAISKTDDNSLSDTMSDTITDNDKNDNTNNWLTHEEKTNEDYNHEYNPDTDNPADNSYIENTDFTSSSANIPKGITINGKTINITDKLGDIDFDKIGFSIAPMDSEITELEGHAKESLKFINNDNKSDSLHFLIFNPNERQSSINDCIIIKISMYGLYQWNTENDIQAGDNILKVLEKIYEGIEPSETHYCAEQDYSEIYYENDNYGNLGLYYYKESGNIFHMSIDYSSYYFNWEGLRESALERPLQFH